MKGGMKLRLSIILAIALMLSASSALAFGGPGSVVVDIVGSRTDNTLIAANGMSDVDLEIIGSISNNTNISSPAPSRAKRAQICSGSSFCPECPACLAYPCPPCQDGRSDIQQLKKVTYPWDNMHLGVDAWYGTFWYTDINMPKWPQI